MPGNGGTFDTCRSPRLDPHLIEHERGQCFRWNKSPKRDGDFPWNRPLPASLRMAEFLHPAPQADFLEVRPSLEAEP
jgi:hypothetical protein